MPKIDPVLEYVVLYLVKLLFKVHNGNGILCTVCK